MSLMSWFHAPQSHRSPALNKPSSRKSSRQPIYARPRLENLEERMMLDAAASNNMLPGSNNPTFNSAQASNGVVLPTTTNFPQTTAVTAGVFPTAVAESALAAVSAPLAAGEVTSQFRSFGVNSQGTDIRQDLNFQIGILMANVYGFGSGTAPNAPWMPNAYNLGLANHQFGYPSQSDMGFGPTPPWAGRVAQALPKEQLPFPDLDLKIDEQEAVKPDEALVQRSLREEEQPRPTWIDDILNEKIERERSPLEQQTAQKQPSLDRILDAEGNLPDSLWLSALAPAPMASLVAGLPGLAVAAESGDGAAECGEGAGEAGE